MSALLLTLAAMAAPLSKHHGCLTDGCRERVAERAAMRACSQRRVVPCIRRGALHWHVDFGLMYRRAFCESTLNPYAVNGPNLGLFQIQEATMRTTPYRARSPFSAKWASLAAAWAQHVGRGGEWTCTGTA